jgi:hypothetical protein
MPVYQPVRGALPTTNGHDTRVEAVSMITVTGPITLDSDSVGGRRFSFTEGAEGSVVAVVSATAAIVPTIGLDRLVLAVVGLVAGCHIR